MILLSAAMLAGLVFFVGRTLRNTGDPAPDGALGRREATDTHFRNTDPSVGYIGSEACAECHQSEHAAYHATLHASSFAVADPSSEPLPAKFHHAKSGIDYWMREEDGAFRMRSSVTLATGETEVLSDHPIAYVVGAGARVRSYAVNIDGFLAQAPMVWNVLEESWELTEGFDVKVHQGFTLPLGEHCLTCHVGRFELAPGSLGRAKVLEAAIGCESCHGPGELHSAFRRGPDAPAEGTTGPDDTIVSLRRMSRAQKMDVCAQCHMDPYMTIVHPGKSRQDWRPGMAWGDVQTTYRPSKESVAPHEFAGHVDQLRASRCFQESTSLTCVTCHGGHSTATAAGGGERAQVNAQCVNCHEVCSRSPSDEAASVPAPAEDDCVSCHMPRRDVSELHLAATRHDIGIHDPSIAPIPTPHSGSVTLMPLQEADHLPAGVRQRNLGLAYLLAAVRTPDMLIKRAYVVEARKALELARVQGVEDAEQLGTLGILDYKKRIGPKGAEKLRLALTLDVENPSLTPGTRILALSTLVDYSFGERNFKAARQYLEELTELRRSAEDWLRLAGLERIEDNLEAAAAAARKGLEILPNEPGFQFQAGDLLGGLGFPEEKKRADRIGGYLHSHHAKPSPK